MTTWMQHNRLAVHGGILALVILFTSVVLLIGYDSTPPIAPEVAEGSPSPETFVADRSTSEFPDEEKTEEARQLAANNVQAPYTTNAAASQAVINMLLPKESFW